MRTLVIGDIHGNARALRQCMDKCDWNPKEDRIIQLGDVADGWSETSECVDILIDIEKQSTHKPVFIRGNHDVWVFDWFNYGVQPIIWTQQGGQATIDSYIRSGKLVDKKHKYFWNNQVDYYIDDQNRLFIHAGLNMEFYEVKDIIPAFLKKVNAGSIAKECHWNREFFNTVVTHKEIGFDFNKNESLVEKALNHYKEIYIGHTALKDSIVFNYHNLWNLDTRAGGKGKLAIMDIDTKEIWYSDFSKDLYPNEKGRI